jgi:prophage maintenance system killer protein
LFHLCSNHGFGDGNKRTSIVSVAPYPISVNASKFAVGAALVFLDANGYESVLTIDELEQITLDVAGSGLDKDRLTELFEAATRPSR